MSPKLPVITSKQLVRVLKRGGFLVDHQTGSHLFMSHPDSPYRVVPIPMHTRDLAKGTLSSILKLVGMTVEELIELL
ncbi:MAG: type II toxin-antitoxin system HicA family toxin [bacterium]|nr:type II toxin-antitoxin system HicA family toxin [bacterium]